MGDDVSVYDGLDSTDPSAALSARQGKILYDMITDTATAAEINAIFD